MLVLHSGCDKFGARASHLREQLFTGLIDERDFFEVNDRAGQRCSFTRLFPTRTQLIHPGSREAPMKAPALRLRGVGITGSKHFAMPFGFEKSMLTAEVRPLIFKGFANTEAEIAAGPTGTYPD